MKTSARFALMLTFCTAILFGCEKAQELANDAKNVANDAKEMAEDAAGKVGLDKKGIWDMTAAPALQSKLQAVGITPEKGGKQITDGVFTYAIEGDQVKGMTMITEGAKQADPKQLLQLSKEMKELAKMPGMGMIAGSFEELSEKLLALKK